MAQQSNPNVEPLEDLSDPVQPYGNGFQLQINNTYTQYKIDESRYQQWIVPEILLRYSFNDRWVLNLRYNNTIDNNSENAGEYIINDDFNSLDFNVLFALDPDNELWIFRKFSFNWSNIFPLVENVSFQSEWDANWSSTFNDLFELDYTLGYVWLKEGNNQGVYSIELDSYLSPKTLLELRNEGAWEWKNFKESFTTDLFIELALLSARKTQFNFYNRLGLNHRYYEVGINLIFTFKR